ncbi:ubiquinol-cytochrome c reductase cytochrome c subunit [Blastococcus sp. DSM 46786]|uniref:cytochrome bc1 complex diheme cytochrome c subunit n=1 Tax=Blastococcus sp. DSM 46786 TaxID=1798227 RepID=UPI0008BC5BA1|nr:c-type cytochrome [Blastococcus sp. DSM 46786]SEK69440.1 ubiquinol-cytochrome c reductase cytochrome c subunit [Blastococcus sp. DSM 46786]
MTTTRSTARGWPALAVVLGILLTSGLLGGQAAADPMPVPVPGTPTAPPPDAAPEDPLERGAELYRASCASCHGQEGGGSQRGPSLEGVGEASVDFQLETGRMPLVEEEASAERGEPAFSEEDIDALVAYVGIFAAGGPEIPTVGPGDLTEGRELYLQNCAACHSASGTGYTQVGGRQAPSLMETDPVQVAEAIRVGPNLMPVWPEEVLDQQQLDSVVSYVQELQRLDGRGGADLGRIGPVAETLVGFAGLALLVVVVRLLGKRAP